MIKATVKWLSECKLDPKRINRKKDEEITKFTNELGIRYVGIAKIGQFYACEYSRKQLIHIVNVLSSKMLEIE